MVEWDPAFRRKNRKLEVAGDKNLRAYGKPGTLSQVIATLLDNALVHGAGRSRSARRGPPTSVVIEVRDEGKGVLTELVPPDLRAQRQRQAGRHRPRPGAGPQHRGRRRRKRGAGPAQARGLRRVPPRRLSRGNDEPVVSEPGLKLAYPGGPGPEVRTAGPTWRRVDLA